MLEECWQGQALCKGMALPRSEPPKHPGFQQSKVLKHILHTEEQGCSRAGMFLGRGVGSATWVCLGCHPPNHPGWAALGPCPERGMLLEGHIPAFSQPGNAMSRVAQGGRAEEGAGAVGRDCPPFKQCSLDSYIFHPS